ncbi:MAG TPA: hypothetical protein VKS82_21990 [Streptosporangiaceae bacterium]|nr:hypothetical protein [Streptosporangiaceae bacterium]
MHAARHARAPEAQRPRQVQQARQVQQSRRVLPPPDVIDPDDVKTAPQPAIRIPIPDAGQAQHPPPASPGQPALTGHGPGIRQPGVRPAGYGEPGIVPGMRRRSPPAPPPWLRVITTTMRLWLSRRWPHRDRTAKDSDVKDSAVKGRAVKHSAVEDSAVEDSAAKQRARSLPWIRAAVLVLVMLLAAAGGVALSRNGTPGGKPTARSNALLTAQTARNEAAAWIAGQVSRNSIVSCDPVMCSVLQSHGYPVANLEVLGPNAPDPLDSSVVVATDALRSQFGSRLTSVYAPLTLASFGTGSAEVDVRVVAPDGAPVYLHQLSADVAARKSLGAVLLRDPRIAAEPAARGQLSAGLVDPRLLLTISTMSALHPLSIVSFGDAAHGAAAGVPLREAILLGGISGSSADSNAELTALARFLHGQQPPYLPVVIQTVRLATGDHALRVQFGAPTPLGLINGNQPSTR